MSTRGLAQNEIFRKTQAKRIASSFCIYICIYDISIMIYKPKKSSKKLRCRYYRIVSVYVDFRGRAWETRRRIRVGPLPDRSGGIFDRHSKARAFGRQKILALFTLQGSSIVVVAVALFVISRATSPTSILLLHRRILLFVSSSHHLNITMH
jgi:hypothetical protein